MDRLLSEMSARFAALLGSAHAGQEAALHQLYALAYREASAMAYADAFRAIMVAFALATPLVLLMRKVAAPVKPPADAH